MARHSSTPGPKATALALAIVAALFSARPAAAASSLATVARELADAMAAAPAGALVVAAPMASDVAGARGDDLAVRLAALVAGRLKGGIAGPRALPLAQARAHLRESGALVHLVPTLDKGRLTVAADLYFVPKNSWDRIRTPSAAPKEHAFAAVPVDAELRTFLPALKLESAAITKVKLDDGDVAAVACGDVDGDGGLELVLVSRSKVSLGRLGTDRFRVERTALWSTLAPRAPVALREPIATATFVDDRVFVGHTDRGGVAVDGELRAASRLRAMPLAAGGLEACAQVVPAVSSLEGAGACSPLAPSASKVPLPVPRFDAAAIARVVAADGTEALAVAVREPQGKLRVRLGDAEVDVRGIDAGADVALADLDLDGTVEVAVSADGLGADDAIAIYSLSRGAEPKLRRRIPTTQPVRALAACPPEAGAAPGLVAIVGAEAWLVR